MASAEVAPSSEAAPHSFVRKLVQSAGSRAAPVVGSAKNLYDSAKATYPMVRFGLEKVEGFSRPFVDQASGKVNHLLVDYADPLLTFVDNKIDVAFDAGVKTYEEKVKPAVNQGKKIYEETVQPRVDQGKKLVGDIRPQVGKLVERPMDVLVWPAYSALTAEAQLLKGRVESSLHRPAGFIDQRLLQPTKAFYGVCVDAWMQLDKDADGRVSMTDFVASIRARLGAWDDRFVKPAEFFYQAAQEQWLRLDKDQDGRVSREDFAASMRQKLDGALRAAVVAGRGLLEPAETFYNSAVEVWLRLDSEHASLPAFVAAMKQRMGALWSDALQAPAETFFEQARAEWSKLMVDENGQVAIPRARLAELRAQLSLALHDRLVEPLLAATERAVNKYLPEPAPAPAAAAASVSDSEADAPAKTELASTSQRLRLLPACVSKRLRRRAMARLTQLRVLSDARLRQIVHVDLIQYAAGHVDARTKFAALEEKFQATREFVVTAVEERLVQPTLSVCRSAADRLHVVSADGSVVSREELRALFKAKMLAVRRRVESQSSTLLPRVKSLPSLETLRNFAASEWRKMDEDADGKVSLTDVSAALQRRVLTPALDVYRSSKDRLAGLLEVEVQGNRLRDVPVALYDRVSKKLIVLAPSGDASTSLKAIMERLREAVSQLKSDAFVLVWGRPVAPEDAQ